MNHKTSITSNPTIFAKYLYRRWLHWKEVKPFVPEIAFDLDGCLAIDTGWKGPDHVGEPVENVCEMARILSDKGVPIWILSARFDPRLTEEDGGLSHEIVRSWCIETAGFSPTGMTAIKRYTFCLYLDDRAVAVERNTGNVKYWMGSEGYRHGEGNG